MILQLKKQLLLKKQTEKDCQQENEGKGIFGINEKQKIKNKRHSL